MAVTAKSFCVGHRRGVAPASSRTRPKEHKFSFSFDEAAGYSRSAHIALPWRPMPAGPVECSSLVVHPRPAAATIGAPLGAYVSESDHSLIQRALGGEENALMLLVDRLTPVIQVRVARALLRQDRRSDRQIGHEVADLTQEVFAALFADGGRVLACWDPARGLSLANFVGLVAQRQACSILRSERRNPWSDQPEDPALLEARTSDSEPSPEGIVASREALQRLLDVLRERLSPQGLEMFYRLYVYRESLEQISAATGLRDAAIYQWKSRITKVAREAVSELEAQSTRAGGAPSGSSGVAVTS
jgi:RNA polymerase sigma factor (sigma-70 family)